MDGGMSYHLSCFLSPLVSSETHRKHKSCQQLIAHLRIGNLFFLGRRVNPGHASYHCHQKHSEKSARFLFPLTVKASKTILDTRDRTWLQSVLDCRENVATVKHENKLLPELRNEAESQLNTLRLPGPKDELWRFTNLRNLFNVRFQTPSHQVDEETLQKFVEKTEGFHTVVLVDGEIQESLCNISALLPNVFIGSINSLDPKQQQLVLEVTKRGETGVNATNIFSSVNLASFRDITVIWVPSDVSVPGFIQLCCYSSKCQEKGLSSVSHPRIVVIMERGSQAKILEHHFGSHGGYLENTCTSLSIGDSASLQYYVVNECPQDAQWLGSCHVQADRYCSLRFRFLSVGGELARLTMKTNIIGSEANVSLHGLSLGTHRRTLDFHSFIDHTVPSAKSEQLQRNIVTDYAQAVFRGLIKIRPDSPGSSAHQLCRSMLLSSHAQTKTMPMLEIANDDVECSHGATVAEFNEDELFYLLARGIPPLEAKSLLLRGFAMDSLLEFPFQSVRDRVEGLFSEMVNNYIHS
eukprot:jgi/Galph1/5248/GphlegSOOS_G3810.1